MVDFLKEQRLTLTQLAKQEGVSIPTPWRWANRGVRGVVLETFNVGGRRFTTHEAFQRFVQRSTAAARGVMIAASDPCIDRQHEVAIEAAERELQEAGA